MKNLLIFAISLLTVSGVSAGNYQSNASTLYQTWKEPTQGTRHFIHGRRLLDYYDELFIAQEKWRSSGLKIQSALDESRGRILISVDGHRYVVDRVNFKRASFRLNGKEVTLKSYKRLSQLRQRFEQILQPRKQAYDFLIPHILPRAVAAPVIVPIAQTAMSGIGALFSISFGISAHAMNNGNAYRFLNTVNRVDHRYLLCYDQARMALNESAACNSLYKDIKFMAGSERLKMQENFLKGAKNAAIRIDRNKHFHKHLPKFMNDVDALIAKLKSGQDDIQPVRNVPYQSPTRQRCEDFYREAVRDQGGCSKLQMDLAESLLKSHFTYSGKSKGCEILEELDRKSAPVKTMHYISGYLRYASIVGLTTLQEDWPRPEKHTKSCYSDIRRKLLSKQNQKIAQESGTKTPSIR